MRIPHDEEEQNQKGGALLLFRLLWGFGGHVSHQLALRFVPDGNLQGRWGARHIGCLGAQGHGGTERAERVDQARA